MKSKTNSAKAVIVIITIGVLALGLFSISRSQSLDEAKAIVSNYSEALSTGQITQSAFYTQAMQDLLQERRTFYEEYFRVGLHSKLESVKSDFIWDAGTGETGAVISSFSPEQISVKVTEKVTLRGRTMGSPEEHPMVLAARWALTKTDDGAAKQELENYIQSVSEEARKSSEDGFETMLYVFHNLIMVKTSTGFQLMEDSFTDQDQVFSGIDRVTWSNGQFARNKPDFTALPDYQRYVLSTEELGRLLLDRVTRNHEK